MLTFVIVLRYRMEAFNPVTTTVMSSSSTKNSLQFPKSNKKQKAYLGHSNYCSSNGANHRTQRFQPMTKTTRMPNVKVVRS